MGARSGDGTRCNWLTRWFTTDTIQTALTALTFLGTVGGWVVNRYVVRRHRLSYRVHWDHAVAVTPRRLAAQAALTITHDGAEVHDPSVVVVRLENVGSSEISFRDPLRFSFGGRRIVQYEIEDAEPESLRDAILATGNGPERLPEPGGGRPDRELVLPRFTMAPKDRFKLLVLLSGPEQGVAARGRLDGAAPQAGIVREGRRGPRSRGSLVLGGASLALGGLLVGLVVVQDAPSGRRAALSCPVTGPLSVTGSTAFAPPVTRLAEEYIAQCPGSNIQVDAQGTDAGVDDLVRSGRLGASGGPNAAARTTLVLADDYPGRPPRDAALGYWPAAIGAFALVANDSTGIRSLSPDQLQQLFDGRYLRWDDPDLGGRPVDVVLVSRQAGSGTREAFEHQVLPTHRENAPVTSTNCLVGNLGTPGIVHCEQQTTDAVVSKVRQTPGAIGYVGLGEATRAAGQGLHIVAIDSVLPSKVAVADGRYAFWAVERIYRYGPALSPTLRDRFTQYVLDDVPGLLAEAGFYRCTDQAFTGARQVEAACAPQNDAASARPPATDSGGP